MLPKAVNTEKVSKFSQETNLILPKFSTNVNLFRAAVCAALLYKLALRLRTVNDEDAAAAVAGWFGGNIDVGPGDTPPRGVEGA